VTSTKCGDSSQDMPEEGGAGVLCRQGTGPRKYRAEIVPCCIGR
jgi:hypothetical protein